MMTRHRLRECLFKAVFQLSFTEDVDIDVSTLTNEEEGEPELSDVERDYIDLKLENIKNHLEEIDSAIEKSSSWKINRIGKAELSILRVAVYEILFDDAVPEKVAVNEAIELAKVYADDKSGAYINGVLAGIIKVE